MGKTKTARITADGSFKVKKPDAFKVSKRSVVPVKTEEDVHKFELTQEPAPVPAFENLGNLPESYGEEVLYLVARDPFWLFCYWDINWTKYPKTKMLGGHHQIFLKITLPDGELESQVQINIEAKNWYLPVKKPATQYVAELGYLDKKGEWKTIVRSQPAVTPATALSDESNATFATIPFHVTFQRIIETVHGAKQEGESLVQTLSRLQTEGRIAAIQAVTSGALTEEQKNILTTLFGGDIFEKLKMGSGEMERLLRKHLAEKLSSETSSGLSAKAAPESSSLSSAVGGWSPEISSLSSAVGGWSPEISSLSSAVGGWSPEISSLFSAAGGWSLEISSLFSAAGGWSPEVSSLFSAAGGWSPEVSSLFSAIAGWGPGSSSLSSGFNFLGPALTQLSSSGMGLWGSENLSSGVGASWSAQPFGQPNDRNFFMHVNAEVIFYGGTHPDAKVWIDGKEIKLNADGTFRYHYRFPDGNYQVPIVAQSPDKIEERSATLDFKRATARKGDVGHTAQPDNIKEGLPKH